MGSFIKASGEGHTSQGTHLWLQVRMVSVQVPMAEYLPEVSPPLSGLDHTIVNHGRGLPKLQCQLPTAEFWFRQLSHLLWVYSSWRILKTFDGLKENITCGILGKKKKPTTVLSIIRQGQGFLWNFSFFTLAAPFSKS